MYLFCSKLNDKEAADLFKSSNLEAFLLNLFELIGFPDTSECNYIQKDLYEKLLYRIETLSNKKLKRTNLLAKRFVLENLF